MIGRSVTLFCCFILGAVVIARSARSEPTPTRMSLTLFPMTIGAWRGVPERAYDEKTLAVLKVDEYLARAYFRSAQSGVGLYVGYYRSQRQGDTIHSPLNCLPGSGWEPVSKTTLSIPVGVAGAAAPPPILVNRYLVQKGLERELVLYWYQSHGRITASEYLSRLYLITDAVRLNRTDGALVRVMAPVSPEPGSEARAERDAIEFVKDLLTELDRYLPV